MLFKKSKSKTSSNNVFNKILKKTFGKFFYQRESILGIDINPHYIRICQMNKSYDQWSISNLSSTCIEKNHWQHEIEENIDLYSESLKELIKKNKIKEKNVSFSVPSKNSVVRVLQFTDMEEAEFHEAAKLGDIWESEIELEGGIDSYDVYYKILRHNKPYETEEDQNEDSNIDNDSSIIKTQKQIIPATIEVLFVASKKDYINLYNKIITNAGLNPLISIPKAISLKYAIDIIKYYPFYI
jgi:Tfp pilus assembly PilM family ATPase